MRLEAFLELATTFSHMGSAVQEMLLHLASEGRNFDENHLNANAVDIYIEPFVIDLDNQGVDVSDLQDAIMHYRQGEAPDGGEW